MPNVITYIMAGGQGSRLYPLTKMRSKPAVPIGGRFRLIDISVSNCIHSNYCRIYILTQFAAESLHSHIFLTYRFSIFAKDFITILSAQQTLESRDWYQGTADAVRQNLGYIHEDDDYVLILSGDHLYRMDYRKFVEYHIEKNADITISVIPVESENAHYFGIMKANERGRIIDFQEKPNNPEALADLKIPEKALREKGLTSERKTHLASMGIYVFKKEVLFDLLKESRHEDFGREVIPIALKRKKVWAYFFNDYWEDIGTIKSFFQAHIDLTCPVPKFNFYDENRPVYTHPRFLPGSKINYSDVENSILCEGSIVDPSTVKNSIVGIRSIIGKGSKLDHVVMMGADYFETHEQKIKNQKIGIPHVGVGQNCEIRRAIVDKNARIGNSVRLVNERNVENEERDNSVIVDGIIVIPKNAVLPDGFTL